MQGGYDRDGDVFVVAALYNDTIFWDAKKRAMLEGFLSGRLIHRYKQRCEHIKKRHQSLVWLRSRRKERHS
jgi:hypothetical protein